MKTIIRYFSLIILSIIFPFSSSAVETATASDILAKCARALQGGKKAVQLDFTIEGQGGNFDGKISLAGNAFLMVVPGVRIWFDGSTHWTLLEDQNTVNISEPTLDELLESNPFVILQNYERRYTALRTDGAPSGSANVLLTPKGTSQAGIKNVTLTVNLESGLPEKVNIVFDNGSRIVAKVNDARHIDRPKSAAFRFNPKDYPSVETVDLR